MNFLLPKGATPHDPAGAWEVVRQQAKTFWEFVENGINVSAFGAVGDGVTDDTESIASAMAYCRTNKQALFFDPKKYIVSDNIDITNVHINGQGAKITSIAEGPTGLGGGITILSANGTADSFYTIDENVNFGDSFIKISNTTFLNSLKIGDLVHIKSNQVFFGANHGEIHKVDRIESWGVKFKDHMFLNYLTSQNATIRKLNPSTGGLHNIKIFSNRINDQERIVGINYTLANMPIVNNVEIHNCYMEGVSFTNCYNPIVNNFAITNTVRDGFGYGVQIGMATMYAYISNGIIHGARHCFASGGGADGVPWEAKVENVTGTIGHASAGTCFDAHSSVGTCKFINCYAISGNHNRINDYPIYNAATTYAIDAKVSSSDGYLYESRVNGNQGNPLTDVTKWVVRTGNLNNGFNARGANVQIINCTATRMWIGIVGVADTTDRLYVKGFQTFDCDNPIVINTTIINDLTIEELTCNSTKQRISYSLSILGSFNRSKISNINVNNYSVLAYRNTALNPTIDINDLNGICGANYTGSVAVSIGDGVDKVKISGKFKGYNIPINIEAVNNVDIDITAEDFLNYAVWFNKAIESVMFKGRLYSPRGIVNALYFRQNVNHILVPYLAYSGSQNFYLIRTQTDKTIGTLQYGNIQNSGGVYIGDFVPGLPEPSIIILSGSNQNIRDCIVTATPEASVTANIGAIARDRVNGKIYFKASGSGNTGWLELDTV